MSAVDDGDDAYVRQLEEEHKTINNPQKPGKVGEKQGAYFYPLDTPCEIKDCGKPAYLRCDSKGFKWKGCGKAMCLECC